MLIFHKSALKAKAQLYSFSSYYNNRKKSHLPEGDYIHRIHNRPIASRNIRHRLKRACSVTIGK